MGEHDPREKGHIADAQECKGSERPFERGGVGQVVGKQGEQVTQELPAHKEHDEIGARHHAQQDERGECNERQIPAVAAILVHVVHGIAIDDGTDS